MTIPAGHSTVASGTPREVSTHQAVAPPGEMLKAAIRRLEGSGASRNIREAADGLRAMGYDLRLAKTTVPGKRPENYLRIMDPQYTAYGIGYLTPTMFSFSRAIDRERLARLPGATLANISVNFLHADSAQPGLAAARLLKDGRQAQHLNKAVPAPQGASSATAPRHTAPSEVHASPGNVKATANDNQRERTPGEWNGLDYYVMFGDDQARSWEDARSYGYVSAGGGSQWSKPLQRLQPGARVFVHHPHDGYVGIGRVVEGPVPVGDFTVIDGGRPRSLMDIPLRNDNIKKAATDPEHAEFLVRVTVSGNGLYQLAKAYGPSTFSHGGQR